MCAWQGSFLVAAPVPTQTVPAQVVNYQLCESLLLVRSSGRVCNLRTSRPQGSQFVGRWDFNLAPGALHAAWLGITENGGALDVWYQPTGGNVYQLKDAKVNGSKLLLTISGADAAKKRPAVTWELEAAGDKLTGVQKRGSSSTPITGVPAPELKRSEPSAWTAPEPLLNGRNLEGWEPIGNPANSHWMVRDGLLVNEEHGANLKTTRTFDDFKVHFEVNCPDDANSGFYLRGRYEVQLEYEPLSSNPPERRIGSIYGRITPKDMPRTPGTVGDVRRDPGGPHGHGGARRSDHDRSQRDRRNHGRRVGCQ